MSNTWMLKSLLRSANVTGDIFDTVNNSSCPRPSDEERRQIRVLLDVAPILTWIFVSVTMVTGLPGSALSLLTFSRMNLTPSTLYFCILAASDFACLVLLGSVHLSRSDEFMSKLFLVMLSFFQGYSNCVLVLICLERFVTVRFPFQKSGIYTIRKTVASACGVFVLNTIPSILNCITSFQYDFKNRRVTVAVFYAILFHYVIVPGCSIVVMSVLTAVSLWQSVRRRNNLTPSAFRQSSKMEADMTRLMFLTATCFVLFVAPFGAFSLTHYIRSFEYDKTSSPCLLDLAKLLHFSNVSIYLSFFNNAVNFYIYLACSSKFRRQCSRLLFGSSGRSSRCM